MWRYSQGHTTSVPETQSLPRWSRQLLPLMIRRNFLSESIFFIYKRIISALLFHLLPRMMMMMMIMIMRRYLVSRVLLCIFFFFCFAFFLCLCCFFLLYTITTFFPHSAVCVRFFTSLARTPTSSFMAQFLPTLWDGAETGSGIIFRYKLIHLSAWCSNTRSIAPITISRQLLLFSLARAI